MRRWLLDLGVNEGHKRRVSALCAGWRQMGGSVLACVADPQEWRPEWRKAAAAIVCGLHGRTFPGRQVCQEAGIPVVVTDLGYVKRADHDGDDGYYQAGIGRIGWLPPFAVPGDRWVELGMSVEPAPQHPGGRILVMGQVPFDSQHGMGQSSLDSWLARRVRGVMQVAGELPVVYRPHPKQVGKLNWEVVERNRPLEDAIRESRVVVTYNSTAGTEAVRLGVPVVCDPGAHYAGVAWAPHRTTREGYFHRLAYAQWTLEELADGTALRFLSQWFARD